MLGLSGTRAEIILLFEEGLLANICVASGSLSQPEPSVSARLERETKKGPALLHPPVSSCTYHTAKGKQNEGVNGRTQPQEGTRNRQEVPLLFKFYIGDQ